MKKIEIIICLNGCVLQITRTENGQDVVDQEVYRTANGMVGRLMQMLVEEHGIKGNVVLTSVEDERPTISGGGENVA